MVWPDLVKAMLLGLVEGATEFVPVSSTGHLIVVAEWLAFTGDRARVFEVFIQLGAILAIVWLYRQKLAAAVRAGRRDPESRLFFINLGVAFVPAAVVGFMAHEWIKAYLFNPLTVSIALVVGGVAILVVERWAPRTVVRDVESIPVRKALGIGLAQVLALFPGVSRSGATIMGGYGLGLSRVAATEFSFFLAIPVMCAATLFDLVENRDVLTPADVPLFATGFAVSFVAALVVVKGLLAFVSRNSFVPFAWYRIAFGLVLLLSLTLTV